MEIIHIILGKANPERMNGVNKVVYQLATRQADSGEQVAVWGITSDKQENYGERNFETRLFVRSGLSFWMPVELKKALLNKKGKAVFHLHGGWIPVFFMLSAWLWRKNMTYVLTPHGAYNVIAMKKSLWTKRFYLLLFERQVIRRAKYIHCIGKSEISGVKSIVPEACTVLIPYGFDVKSKISEKSLDTAPFIVGFVGRLDIYTKGLDLLLAAFARFEQNHADARLWLIGDGPEREKLEVLVENFGLDQKVIFYGSKFGQEKEELIRRMDVFVHPSRNEGLPMSVIEAAAAGKICIVTEATNIGDEIQRYNAGFCLKNEALNSLADALSHIADLWETEPEHFVSMGKNAHVMITESFNWEYLIKRFHNELYELS